MPFKDQNSADVVPRQLRDLERKINHELQPIQLTRKMIIDDLRNTELKPPIGNQQKIVYEFTCDLCNANYKSRLHLPSPPSKCRGTFGNR